MSDDFGPDGGGAPGDEARGADDLGASARRMLEDAFNQGDFTAVNELTAPDAITHDPTMPVALQRIRGPEPFKQVVRLYRAAFPDVRFVVDDTIAQGDKVVLRWHAHGTHRGRLQGLAPTEVHASITGISISRWQDGRMVEVWVEWDNLGLARQIGAAPPEGSVGERVGAAIQQLVARRLRSRATA